MALITFPGTPKPRDVSWKLMQPTQLNVSQWTGRRQAIASGRGWWECNLTLPPIVGRSNFNPWRVFLAQARGGANEFQVPIDATPQLAGATTAAVDGAGQTGRSLNCDGFPVSTTVLEAGQFVTINDQLLQLTSDIISNGSGEASINFEPLIRVSPDDNATVEFRNPYALMYLNEIPAYNATIGDTYSLSLDLRELI